MAFNGRKIIMYQCDICGKMFEKNRQDTLIIKQRKRLHSQTRDTIMTTLTICDNCYYGLLGYLKGRRKVNGEE